MRISKILKMTAALMIGALTVTSCANDVETDINIDPSGDAISFSPSVGHASRATEVNIGNLGNFAVIAKGIHQSGDLYSQYIIGGEENNVVKPSVASHKSDESTSDSKIWKLDHSVYWPSDMSTILFWAYTTDNTVDGTETLLSSGKVTFENNGPKLSSFSPEKADLNAASATGRWDDGSNQKDLLFAFTQQKKSEGTSVSLNFEHALTQIDIQAKQDKGPNPQDHRVVKIRGAWIYNVNTQGDLSASFSWDGKTATQNPNWNNLSVNGCYGSYYSAETTLDSDQKGLLGNSGSLMIIPQSVNEPQSVTEDTYILLLCRIELKHAGASHDGNADDIFVDGANNQHYHQLFPVADEYNAKQYGFACVKLNSMSWVMGMKYRYVLDICGANSGAGIYPPGSANDTYDALVPESERSQTEPNIIIVHRKVKDDGDPVLDDPIKFTVTVESWPDNWTAGNTETNK